MTEISEAAKRKACQLVNAEPDILNEWLPRDVEKLALLRVFAHVLQEHSDVAKYVDGVIDLLKVPASIAKYRLQSLILPDDPDPVEAALNEWFDDDDAIGAVSLREYLAKHGLKIIKQD